MHLRNVGFGEVERQLGILIEITKRVLGFVVLVRMVFQVLQVFLIFV